MNPHCTRALCDTPDDVSPARIANAVHAPILCRAHDMEDKGDEALASGAPRTARIAYEHSARLRVKALA